jgi:hypothetical protein
MRIDNARTNFLTIQPATVARPEVPASAIGQLIDLAVQKAGVRADNSIPEAARQAKLQKLEQLSAPINQQVESDRVKKMTKDLVDAAQDAQKDIEEASKPADGDAVDPATKPDATATTATTATTDAATAAPAAAATTAPAAADQSSEAALAAKPGADNISPAPALGRHIDTHA